AHADCLGPLSFRSRVPWAIVRATADLPKSDRHGPREPGGGAEGFGKRGQDDAQLADRRLRLSGRRSRVHELARRTARMGRDVRPFRPVPPHGEPVRARARRPQAALLCGDQLVQEFGPNAERVIRKLNGGPFPDIKFFNMDYITIAGRKVRALPHGMAGAPRLAGGGAYAGSEENRRANLEAGHSAR